MTVLNHYYHGRRFAMEEEAGLANDCVRKRKVQMDE